MRPLSHVAFNAGMASIRPRSWINRDGSKGKAYVVDYVDQKGKRRSKQFRRRREAESFRDGAAQEVRAGVHVAGRDAITVAEAVEIWLGSCAAGRGGRDPVRQVTLNDYRELSQRHVLPELGRLKLTEITAPRVVAFRDWLLSDDGPGRPTAQKALQYLKSSLDEALLRGKVAADCWSKVSISLGRRYVGGEGEVEIPSRAEASALLATAQRLREAPAEVMGWDAGGEAWRRYHRAEGPRGWEHVQRAWVRYHPMTATAFWTGVRQSELRALHREDFDAESRTIQVRRSADKLGGLNPTKSPSSRRTIEIPAVLTDLLRDWLKDRPAGPLLFPAASGAVQSRTNINKRCWGPLLRYARVAHYKYHAQRHWFASMQIASGANAKEVQKVMGHADIQTTFNLYGHLFPEDAAARFARADAIAAATLEPAAMTQQNGAK